MSNPTPTLKSLGALAVKGIYKLKISNQMNETHLTPENQIYIEAINKRCNQMEFQADSEKDLLLDYEIEKAIERQLFLNDVLADFKFLLNYKYPYESKGDNLKGNLTFTSYVQKELQKGRSKEDLLIELKAK